jgi:hypothetical protein
MKTDPAALSALMADLLAEDIAEWSPHVDRIETDELIEARAASLPPVAEWLHEMVESADYNLLRGADGRKTKSDLHEAFRHWVQEKRLPTTGAEYRNLNAFASALYAALPGARDSRPRSAGQRERTFVLPTIEEAAAALDAAIGDRGASLPPPTSRAARPARARSRAPLRVAATPGAEF